MNGRSLPISRDGLAQISFSKQIQKLFFNAAGQELSVKFRIKPSSMSTDVTEFRMVEVESIFDYRHGPRVWREINWPSNSDESELTSSFYRAEDRVATQTYNGKWGGFIRVIFDSKISATSDRQVNKVLYEIDGKHIVVDMTVGDSSVKFNKLFFSGYKLPPRKL